MQQTIKDNDGYAFRAIRKAVGTFDIVAIDWEHPNYGYCADGMLWISSPHLTKWRPFPIVQWTQKYKTLQSFLRDFPQFFIVFQAPENSATRLFKNMSKGKEAKKLLSEVKKRTEGIA
jgi:hypothetical protein